MRTIKASILSVGLGSLFLGCASVPLADATADARAKLFVPSASAATVYVVREGFIASGFHTIFRVAVDGREIGVLAPWTYLILDMSPGAHAITATGPENQDRLTLETEPGRLVFVRLISRPGWMSGHASLSVVAESTGRDLVQRSSLARP